MKKGFTLVELITVIIIIAILAALALPQYFKVVERGQAAKAKATLDAIRKAQSIYYSLYSEYAGTFNAALQAEVPEMVATNLNDADWTYGLWATGSLGWVAPFSATLFTATARRLRGAFADPVGAVNSRLTVTSTGKITTGTVATYPF